MSGRNKEYDIVVWGLSLIVGEYIAINWPNLFDFFAPKVGEAVEAQETCKIK